MTAGRASLSVCVVTHNEEDRLRPCLESVRWADEIVVVDAHSTDRTREVAAEFGARVIERDWPGFVAQKNFALEQATREWVLCLDADERVGDELRDQILRVLEAPADSIVGYEMPRHVFYLGRWINHGGWYPDRKTRLVRRGRARWGGEDPHDKLKADGPVGRLSGDLIHHTYRNFSHQLQIIDRFSDVVTAARRARPPALPLLRMLFHPPIKFLECYVWKLGFLDGLPGLIIAAASAFYVFAKIVKAWESRRCGSDS
jgi:glycosyltransferase involved in cell wall biosynthesis